MDHDKYPTIFHIDIDAFFASVEEVLCPALRGKPVVVGGMPDGALRHGADHNNVNDEHHERGIVSCPNYEARRLGVKTAMSLSQAYKIAPNAVFVRGHYDEYAKYSRKFMEILHNFSPVVRPVSLDEAFLDADGCLHFWAHELRNLASAIKRAIWDELRITVSIGIASNRLCAKVASDYSKKIARNFVNGISAAPNGLFIVQLGEEKNFLAPLPVSAIPGIGKRTTEALGSIGIKTVGELANTTVDMLRKLFGVVGAHLHDAANGIGAAVDCDSLPLPENERDAKSISRSTTFAEDSNDEEFISSVFFYLSEKVARSLRRNRRVASTITMKMRYSDGAAMLGYRTKDPRADRRFVTYQKNHSLEVSTNSEFEIAASAVDLFKSLWRHRTKVRLVGVGVTNIRRECMQLDVFQQSGIKRANLLNGIDSLREKFGYHSVYFGIINQLDDSYSVDHYGFDANPPVVTRANPAFHFP